MMFFTKELAFSRLQAMDDLDIEDDKFAVVNGTDEGTSSAS